MGAGRKGRWSAVIVSAVLAGYCLAGPASASVVLETDFKRVPMKIQEYGGVIVDDAKGKGWSAGRGGRGDNNPTDYLDIDLASVKADRSAGTFDFLITRGEKWRDETVLTLTDGEGGTRFAFKIYWGGATQKEKPEIVFVNRSEWGSWQTSFGPLDHGTELYWNNSIPFPHDVGTGKDVRLTVTWGKEPSNNAVFIDGQRLRARLQEPFDFGAILKGSPEMLIGVQLGGYAGLKYVNRLASPLRSFSWLDVPTPPDQVPEIAAPQPSSIDSLEINAGQAAGFSGSLVAGNRLAVGVKGTAGAAGVFDLVHLTDLNRKITVGWQGYGVYLEDKSFYEADEVNLRDVSAYRVYISKEPIDPASPAGEPAARLTVKEQTYTFENLEVETPYYTLVLAEMRDGTLRTVAATPTGIPLVETSPGVYDGAYAITYRDRFERAVVVARLAQEGAAAGKAVSTAFVVDPALRIAVGASPEELRADEKSTSKVTVTVTDANGNPVAGHKIRFLLATTSQYTGVVGGGAFTEQVGGSISESLWAETDLFGRVAATYVAGFAAKTAVIVARDMLSNDTGAGWVKTFIQATAQLELEPVRETAAMNEGYEITVTSSDEWLTADGKSQARITALVTLLGKPVEGHRVGFTIASGTGSIRAVAETTGRDGKARAVYTAGKKIGMVLVTATDLAVGISGSVQIELRSDAPAKIAIQLKPEKLPADGRSRADLLVTVTDINDNPNDNTEVEYAITEGGGSLREERGLTDRRGENENTYTAGTSPGRVTIELTVRSTVPSDAEIQKARALALAVTDYEFF